MENGFLDVEGEIFHELNSKGIISVLIKFL